MIIRCFALSLLALSVSACKINGSAQKGPFKAGSTVTATLLDAQANPTGTSSRSTIVRNDQGDYLVTRINWDGWTEVTASGLYFDEIQNTDSTATIQLNAISNKDIIFDTVNTHIFSTLAASRIRQLVSNGQSIDAAWAATQTEIASTFGLTNLDIDGVEQLDPSDGSSDNAENNAILLLFSGAFLDAGGDLAALQSLSADFADDAQFNGAGADIFNSIAQSAGKPNILNTISANLVANGATNPPNSSNLTNLPQWVAAPGTPNEVPVAEAQSVTVEGGVSTTITLTGTDADNETLSFAITSEPSFGQAALDGAEVTYTPDASFSGADSFAFTANDGTDTSDAANVSITVNPVIIPNEIPVANPQSITVEENSSENFIMLSATDADINDTLEYTISSNPSKGSATISGNVVTYIPNPESVGSDSFNFVVNDGTANSDPATVSITINEQVEPLPRFQFDQLYFQWENSNDISPSNTIDLNQFNIGGVATSWELLEAPSNTTLGEPPFEFPVYEIPSNNPSNPIPLTFNVGTPKDATQTTDMFSLSNEGIFTRDVLGEGLPAHRMIIKATNAFGDSIEIPLYLCVNDSDNVACEVLDRAGFSRNNSEPNSNPGIPSTISVTGTVISDLDFVGGTVEVFLAGNSVKTEPLVGGSFDIDVITEGVSFGSVAVKITGEGDGFPVESSTQTQFLQAGKTDYNLGQFQLRRKFVFNN